LLNADIIAVDSDNEGTALKLAAHWEDSLSLNVALPPSGRRTQIRLNGELVEVVRFGRGEPLVLVPGLAGSWKLTLPLARRLARHHEVITYALRGDGCLFSSLGKTWDIGGHADDLAQLIDRLALERPTVMGISFGGAIALEMAVEHPGRLGSLIVQGAAASFPSTIGSTVARRVLERFPLPIDNRFVNQFFNLLHGSRPDQGPLVDFVVETIWDTDQSVIAQRLAQLEAFDVSDRLWRIDAPTLVVSGSKDAIVKPSRQVELARMIPGARYEAVEGAGHIGFLTHGSEVARLVHRHLRKLKAPVW